MFWDFLTLRAESTHQVMFLFGDRGIPDGYRYMHGFGSHTFVLVNNHDERYFCKFHYKVSAISNIILIRIRRPNAMTYIHFDNNTNQTNQGIKNLAPAKAAQIAGSDPDYSIRDLYNAIARQQYPSWTFYIQIMTPSQAETFKWNPFDLTKVLRHYQLEKQLKLKKQERLHEKLVKMHVLERSESEKIVY